MKLLVFAHTPPPHHGQSYMVQLMLEGFGGDRRRQPRDQPPASPYGIECYHVNARLSRNLSDIGEFRPGKLVLLVRYCLEAIWCHYRHGIDTIYYIPSPGKKSALLRDWIVMTLCRPFFSKIILHWHASGLGKWLETSAPMRPRARTYRLIRQADLSIVLSKHGQRDALKWLPKKIAVVANGIPDPCPEFEQDVLPRRKARAAFHAAIMKGHPPDSGQLQTGSAPPETITVLFLGHCTRDKGLFDTISGVTLAARELEAGGSRLSLRLLVAGAFILPKERAEFDQLMKSNEVNKLVTYVGFVSGEQKRKLLKEADIFCFPTFFHNESQPVTLIEAMAYGLSVVTTRWRSVHEVLPHGYPGTVEPKRPDQVAKALLATITENPAQQLREHFLNQFTEQEHLTNLSAAIRSVEAPRESPAAGVPEKPRQAAMPS